MIRIFKWLYRKLFKGPDMEKFKKDCKKAWEFTKKKFRKVHSETDIIIDWKKVERVQGSGLDRRGNPYYFSDHFDKPIGGLYNLYKDKVEIPIYMGKWSVPVIEHEYMHRLLGKLKNIMYHCPKFDEWIYGWERTRNAINEKIPKLAKFMRINGFEHDHEEIDIIDENGETNHIILEVVRDEDRTD